MEDGGWRINEWRMKNRGWRMEGEGWRMEDK